MRVREREKGKWVVVTDTTPQETVSPVLKVPRQYPLVLLVYVAHMIGFFIIFYIRSWKGSIIVKFELTLGGLY
jgi:hypothetical protein